jgi:hypothetical protein
LNLNEQVTDCEVLLAIIGKNWRGARSADGRYTIEQDDDFVRIEIAAALNGGKLVIPVLIGDAQIVREADLPPSLKALARCLIPGFDGALFSREWKDALWARFSTAAPQRQRRSVERYNIVCAGN